MKAGQNGGVQLAATLVVAGLLAGCGITQQPEPAPGGKAWHKAVIQVRPIPKILDHPEDQVVMENDQTVFTVRVEDKNKYNFQWYRNEVSLKNADAGWGTVAGWNTWHLRINKVKADAAALYHCRITDKRTGEFASTAPVALFVIRTNSPVSVTGPLYKKTGTLGTCPGSYIGYVKFKNASGSSWWSPPSNATKVNASDISTEVPEAYASSIEIVENTTLRSACANRPNVVTMSVTNTAKYAFTIYVAAPSNLASGTPITIQINWQ